MLAWFGLLALFTVHVSNLFNSIDSKGKEKHVYEYVQRFYTQAYTHMTVEGTYLIGIWYDIKDV